MAVEVPYQRIDACHLKEAVPRPRADAFDRVFDKDRGIVASLDCKQNLTRKGEPLPCERPNRAWREPILETLSVPAAGGKENKETTITPTRRRNNGSN